MIAENLTRIQNRMEVTAKGVNRNPTEITLIGVSKYTTLEAMLAAYKAGLRHFGESRVEEMATKVPAFIAATDPTDPPIIHMIGHLQSRKVAEVLKYAHTIHSVDSLKLAERINRLTERENYAPKPILLECNISGEASKAGFEMSNWEEIPTKLNDFFEVIAEISILNHVYLQGLMTMAPFVANAEEARPIFRSLQALYRRCVEKFPNLPWCHLSMGMTNDFDVAIEEGATFLRIGRAIFST